MNSTFYNRSQLPKFRLITGVLVSVLNIRAYIASIGWELEIIGFCFKLSKGLVGLLTTLSLFALLYFQT